MEIEFGPAGRFVQWLFVSGDRRVVTASLLAFVYVVLLLLWVLAPVEIQLLLTETNTIQQLFNTLLSGAILLISIVVSINSLVVSQELAPIGSQHERVVESWNFREEAAEVAGTDIGPAAPAQFLDSILTAVDRQLDDLDSIRGDLDPEIHEDVEDYVAKLREGIALIRNVLATEEYAGVNVVLFGPAYDPSTYIDDARSLRLKHRSAFTDEVDATIDEIVSALQYFATAREYFKTVYYKREFSHLSRDLLYAGLPAILLISYVLLALDAQFFPGRTFGVDNVFLFFSLAYVVALAPYLVLTAYVLRAAVIAENTVTAGAFILES